MKKNKPTNTLEFKNKFSIYRELKEDEIEITPSKEGVYIFIGNTTNPWVVQKIEGCNGRYYK